VRKVELGKNPCDEWGKKKKGKKVIKGRKSLKRIVQEEKGRGDG
jgi:hypothetical protein